MKKILLKIFLCVFILNFGIAFGQAINNNCGKIPDDLSSDPDALAKILKDCEPKGIVDGKSSKEIGNVGSWLTISTTSNDGYTIMNAKNKMLAITKNLVILASILGIGGIVYGGILLTTAYGDDGKLKKGKDAMKYSAIGFLVAIIAQQLVNAIINLIYGVSG